jgi:hypothetical protein
LRLVSCGTVTQRKKAELPFLFVVTTTSRSYSVSDTAGMLPPSRSTTIHVNAHRNCRDKGGLKCSSHVLRARVQRFDEDPQCRHASQRAKRRMPKRIKSLLVIFMVSLA